MTITTVAGPAPFVGVGSAPAGPTPAQQRTIARIRAMSAVTAQLPPLDPDHLDAERHWEQWRRWNGED